jgi:uncharacterized protein
MYKKLKIILFILLSHLTTTAQDGDFAGKYLSTATSSKGNYIYLLTEKDLLGKDSLIMKSTDYFIIERMPYNDIEGATTKPTLKKIGEAKLTSSVKELNQYYSAEQINQFKEAFQLKRDEDVVNYFTTHFSLQDYFIAYNLVETKLALGHVYLDTDVKEGEVFYYHITRVDKNKTTEDWGYSIAQSKAGNYLLPYYKPKISAINILDSSVDITWKMAVTEDIIKKIPIPKSNLAIDRDGALTRTPFTPLNSKAVLYIKSNSGFKSVTTLLPIINETNDTVTYSYQKPCVPEETISAFLVTQDEIYNKGIESDTAYTIAIDQKTIPLIYSVRVNEIVNGIQLNWDKLPNKPYLTGIEIGRYNSDEKYDSVATVSAMDTSFTDYKIAVGQHYRYKVKAVFLPQLNIEQAVPAEAVGTFTIFNKPLPVTNLSIENKNKLPFLKWDEIKDPSFYGSFIYRGTSSKNLSVIAGPIKTNYFIDSATSVTGRSEYYYAIINQNLREDTSVFSEVVRIVPDKKIEITFPSTMEFYYANGTLNISWNDVRAMDNSIESFVVQKKISTQKSFLILGNSINNNLEDADIKDEITYEYRVAAISYKGDTSDYSNAYTFNLAPKEIPEVNIFYTRNVSEGIEISWPSIIYQNRKSYNIYRRLATEQDFTKVATVPSNTFLYVDKTGDGNKIYVYKISVTQNDGKEGEQGKSVSIRRLKK